MTVGKEDGKDPGGEEKRETLFGTKKINKSIAIQVQN